ncbi:mitochondrial coenzyme A diphosphatase NUDT8-like [Paramacrobiotus metropolitanus]|uniref:mitochondrial coenzyme A diphosphatase NUDT8-like n=1 Tax=Paramacrobiotus metropolitanus TaxID=2943436 RepID=UPI0024464D6E|nr:mitochondrial coenzyme A diphosphatase NUDT8-like [Paramacrobiotus metropolitanus]
MSYKSVNIISSRVTTALRARQYATVTAETTNFPSDWRFDSHKADFLRHAAAKGTMVLPSRQKGEGLGRPEITTQRSTGSYAVLVPFCTVKGIPSVLFTLRSSNLAKHRGEISFPGGKSDPTDKDVIHTALRETQEEIGVPVQSTDIWTTLPPMPTRDGAMLSAVVGYTGDVSMDEFKPNPTEVEEIFTCSMASLLNPENVRYTSFRTRHGLRLPVFVVNDGITSRRIWGMTAVILLNVLQCFEPGFCLGCFGKVKMIK